MSEESRRSAIERYAEMVESRQFTNALRVYEEFAAGREKNDWNKGYLRALRGIFLVKKAEDDQAFFGERGLNRRISTGT